MKKIVFGLITSAIAALLGWAYVTYASGLPMYSRSVAETVLVDKTEDFGARPTGTEVLSPLQLTENTWERVELRLRTISKYEFTESSTLTLPGHFFLLSNPDERDKEISSYQAKIDSVINGINAQKNGYSKSSIYSPLIAEVNRVAQTKADLKIVIAYTDGCENTGIFSVYRAHDRDLLTRHPEKVRELLARFAKPCDLHGVTVYLIFKPKTDLDNENFTLMSGFYQKLLQDAGAKVVVGADVVITEN